MIYNRLVLLLISVLAFCSLLSEGANAQNVVCAESPDAPKIPIYHLYLTFDDGPLRGSEHIDDAIKTEKIKINVFVIGSHVQASSGKGAFYRLYEVNPFIEIGNHGYTHANDVYRL